MEHYFTSLSKRQTMLLLTSLAFGGADAVSAYDHLNSGEEELLKHRAAGLLQIPREKRVLLLVQEIKRLVTQRRRQLAVADPKRLVALLRQERPAVAEVVLGVLASDVAKAVRSEMGNPPPLRLTREVRPEVLSIVRWKLEDALSTQAHRMGRFRFTDLATMQQREILAVADRMGARVLATAVAGLSDDDRTAFLAKLPPDQRALASRAAEAGAARRLLEEDAKTVLEMHGALENPSQGMRSAGVQRLVRACYAQSPEFAVRFGARHHGELGKLLGRWLREEKGKPVKGDGGRSDIVEQFERLAQKGILDRPLRLPPPMDPQRMPPPVLRPPPGSSPSQTQSTARGERSKLPKPSATPPMSRTPRNPGRDPQARRAQPSRSSPTDSPTHSRVSRGGSLENSPSDTLATERRSPVPRRKGTSLGERKGSGRGRGGSSR